MPLHAERAADCTAHATGQNRKARARARGRFTAREGEIGALPLGTLIGGRVVASPYLDLISTTHATRPRLNVRGRCIKQLRTKVHALGRDHLVLEYYDGRWSSVLLLLSVLDFRPAACSLLFTPLFTPRAPAATRPGSRGTSVHGPCDSQLARSRAPGFVLLRLGGCGVGALGGGGGACGWGMGVLSCSLRRVIARWCRT